MDAYPELRDHWLASVAVEEHVDQTMLTGLAPAWSGDLADLIAAVRDLQVTG